MDIVCIFADRSGVGTLRKRIGVCITLVFYSILVELDEFTEQIDEFIEQIFRSVSQR